MNNWAGIGNLTRDPEIRETQSGKSICRFTIAINDGYGDRKETNYIPITVFGKVAENCHRFLSKGRKVAVMGRIKTGSYEKNGQKVYTTEVVASGVEFLSPSEEKPKQEERQQGFNAPEERRQSFDDTPVGFGDISDDDIPFA